MTDKKKEAAALTEKKGINFLKENLLKTGMIDPRINDTDKEISWDGELYVYDDKEHFGEKTHLSGRIPIQIKSTNIKKPKKTY
ncbi:MAG: hypothetical protein LBM75_08710 [Myxococcales bacterium]|nr:hypothetical protein [Myxococcales bacterium]